MRKQFRLSVKSGNLTQRDRVESTRRQLKTAMDGRNSKKTFKEFQIPTREIASNGIKRSPILHQSLDSCDEGSVLLLPRNIEEARQPKTHRQMIGDRITFKDQYEKYDDSRKEKERSSHWRTFSRKNLQFLNKKLKNIRSSKYISNKDQLYLDGSIDKENDKFKILVGTFVCKSLEPILHHSPKCRDSKLRQTQTPIGEDQRQKQQNFKRSDEDSKNVTIQESRIKFKKTDLLKGRQRSSSRNEFHTKMKKKCLQNNPHVLASIIRRKNECVAKAQLYQFVQKIMERSKKH